MPRSPLPLALLLGACAPALHPPAPAHPLAALEVDAARGTIRMLEPAAA